MKVINKINKILNKLTFNRAQFSDLNKLNKIYLYAGDVPPIKEYSEYIGLSIEQWNKNHIKHDVTQKYPLEDNTIDRYQAEDVFEHIHYDQLPSVINEIHRILKKDAIFRLCLPDYQCDILSNRTLKNDKGEFTFDPVGGGKFIDGKVVKGGHLWFPTYNNVKVLLEKTNFKSFTFLHYYDENGNGITNKIDYSKGFVMRTPDHDDRVKNPYRPLSLVVDCKK